MNNFFVLIIATFTSILAISGCSTPTPKQTLPRLTYSHMTPLKFAVETVIIDNRYKAPNDPAYIENWFPTSPANAVRTWALERLKPVGYKHQGDVYQTAIKALRREY